MQDQVHNLPRSYKDADAVKAHDGRVVTKRLICRLRMSGQLWSRQQVQARGLVLLGQFNSPWCPVWRNRQPRSRVPVFLVQVDRQYCDPQHSEPRRRNAQPSGETPDWTSSCTDGGGEFHVESLRAAQQVAGRPLRFADGLDALHSGHQLAKYRLGLHPRELCAQA